MNREETTALLRIRRDLTGSTYNDDTIKSWQRALGEWSYEQCRDALERAARDEKRITVAHVVERLSRPTARQPREIPLCIRCVLLPAEPGRNRCAPCQAVVDEELSRGVHDPTMLDAVRAARRR